MRIFISGAASPLGRALTSLLVRRGDAVIGQARRRSAVAAVRNLGAEPLIADLSNAWPLVDGMRGCDLVFHLAQYFDFWAPSLTTYHHVNVFGTQTVMNAAVWAEVPRVVFCSTSLAIGERPGEIGTARTAHRGYARTAFERSKVAAETLALTYRAKGVEVVIVNPALVVAPSDPGWTGRLIASQVSGRRKFASTAPVGWVSVTDAARGVLLAAERGRSGTRHILCGDTLSPREFLSHVARLAGQSEPQPLSPILTRASAFVSTRVATALHRRPALPLDEGRFVSTGFRVDGVEAALRLEFDYTPLSRYLPPVVASYRRAIRRFAD